MEKKIKKSTHHFKSSRHLLLLLWSRIVHPLCESFSSVLRRHVQNKISNRLFCASVEFSMDRRRAARWWEKGSRFRSVQTKAWWARGQRGCMWMISAVVMLGPVTDGPEEFLQNVNQSDDVDVDDFWAVLMLCEFMMIWWLMTDFQDLFRLISPNRIVWYENHSWFDKIILAVLQAINKNVWLHSPQMCRHVLELDVACVSSIGEKNSSLPDRSLYQVKHFTSDLENCCSPGNQLAQKEGTIWS